jgi:hypothetical protein
MSDESIYNLVPREYVAQPKQPMFRSKHDPNTVYPGSTFGCDGTTRLIGAGKLMKKEFSHFGPSRTRTTDTSPTSTLKAAAKESLVSSTGESLVKFRSSQRRDKIPSKDDKPVYGIRSSKNFITANAVEAILKVPKSLESKELNYLKKEDYGKVPEYLSQVKEEIKRENEMIQKYVKEQMGEVEEEPEQFEEMSEAERGELLDALKAKWDRVNAQYQKMTHLVRLDTTGQMRRKEQLESELKALENEIERLSRPGPILIRGY